MLTAAAILATTTGVGLVVGVFVGVAVGIGAALIVCGSELWLLASNLMGPADTESAATEPVSRAEVAPDLVPSADISIADPEGEPEVGVARLYQALR